MRFQRMKNEHLWDIIFEIHKPGVFLEKIFIKLVNLQNANLSTVWFLILSATKIWQVSDYNQFFVLIGYIYRNKYWNFDILNETSKRY